MNRPLIVLSICSFLAFINLVIDGSLLRIWGLHQEIHGVRQQSYDYNDKINAMNKKIKRAADPEFIKQEAVDRLDMVHEGDLVFVFSDED